MDTELFFRLCHPSEIMLLQPRIAQLQVLTSQYPSQETDESRCTYDEDPTLDHTHLKEIEVLSRIQIH